MKHLIIGTAGHVDHGKTALIKALTDIDCDTHKEEKERGITINLGFSHLDLPSGESIGIVDVPGHKDFIRTMVAGAYGIDIALLVIAADSGIMPQTEEHLRIIEMLGVSNGIVAITKVDLVDEETAELAELEIAEHLEGSNLENAPIIPVSSVTGQGIKALIETIEGLVPTLKEKEAGDVFRMYIDRFFNVKGIGFVVTGTVLEGQVSIGKDLFLLPGISKKIKIRNIERHGESVESVIQGDRAALNLSGLKQEDFSRGMILSSKQLEESGLIDATFKVFNESSVLPIWSNVLFISGTFETACRMHILDTDELQPGDTGLVQIHLDKPAVIAVKDKYIIRNSSNDVTIGGGTVIDISPLHHRKRTDKLIAGLKDLVDATLHSDNLLNVVKIELNKINAPVYASVIAKSLDKPNETILKDIQDDDGKNIRMFESLSDVVLIRPDLDNNYKKMIIAELEAYHQKYPILEEGLDINELSGKFQFNKNEAGKQYIEILMGRMIGEGLIRKTGKAWAKMDHVIEIDPKTVKDLEWIENFYKDTGMDLAISNKLEDEVHQRKINKDRLKMLQKYLSYENKLVFHEGNIIHHSNVAVVWEKLFQRLKGKDDGINEKEFRELINGTRKFVQVILGLFISQGLVTKPSFFILLTEKGKQKIENYTN